MSVLEVLGLLARRAMMTRGAKQVMAAEDAVPHVHAVVVNYNTGSRLIDCVRALLAETGFELIWVVDNASVDGSLAALEAEFGADVRLRILRNTANLGFGAANNRALRQARDVDWLLVNPDCMLHPGSLQAFRTCRGEHGHAGLLGGLVSNPDGSEQRGCRRDLPGVGNSLLRSLGMGRVLPRRSWNDFDHTGTPLPAAPVRVGAVSGALMYLAAEALHDIGDFDEGYFLHCEDLDLCKRMADGGWEVWFVPGTRAVHFQGTSSRRTPARVEWHKHRGMWRYFTKFQREASPLWLVALVWLGIWCRFLLLVPTTWCASLRSVHARGA